jgi:hypothetical protein
MAAACSIVSEKVNAIHYEIVACSLAGEGAQKCHSEAKWRRNDYGKAAKA